MVYSALQAFYSLELLQKYELSGEEQHKYESIIIDKLKQLSQLIEDFFTFTKIISNEEKFELKLLDINRIFEEELVCYYQDFNNGAFLGGAYQDVFCALLFTYYFYKYYLLEYKSLAQTFFLFHQNHFLILKLCIKYHIYYNQFYYFL